MTQVLEDSGFPASSAGEESACNVGDLGLIPGLGRAPGEGNYREMSLPELRAMAESMYDGKARKCKMRPK